MIEIHGQIKFIKKGIIAVLLTYAIVCEIIPAAPPQTKLPVGDRTVSPVVGFTLVDVSFKESRYFFILSNVKKLRPAKDLDHNMSTEAVIYSKERERDKKERKKERILKLTMQMPLMVQMVLPIIGIIAKHCAQKPR